MKFIIRWKLAGDKSTYQCTFVEITDYGIDQYRYFNRILFGFVGHRHPADRHHNGFHYAQKDPEIAFTDYCRLTVDCELPTADCELLTAD